jgi:small ligand-binding sensory domain FIST
LSEKSSLHEFCQLLDTVYPNSSKIGIQTSPMIFNTGQPSCLFGHSEILAGGVVGIALPSKKKVMMEFSDLIPFSEKLIISECKGNVLVNWEGPQVSFDDLKDALYIQLLDYEMVVFTF